MNLLQWGVDAVEQGWVPDRLTRLAIRRLCGLRLRQSRQDRMVGGPASAEFSASLRSGPIAPVPDAANRQHYELPVEFFAAVLGPRRKYSCCYFVDEQTTLSAAEDAALAMTCERAQLSQGQNILELGCGWGAVSLWMAEKYSGSRITAVSNSVRQTSYIAEQARSRGLTNLQVIRADMNDFAPPTCSFDRVVSVEMIEHMRNYEALLARIASWLKPGGKLFVHLFCHRELSYPFADDGAANWMGRHFFTGGIMPSLDLLGQFNRDLTLTERATWNGQHYQRTALAWLANLDANRAQALRILADVYGPGQARTWLQRWRMFLLAVAELFGYAGGQEWMVAHCLLERPPAGSRQAANG